MPWYTPARTPSAATGSRPRHRAARGFDDATIAGLPAICDLDEGHAGPHAESQGAGGVEWPNDEAPV